MATPHAPVPIDTRPEYLIVIGRLSDPAQRAAAIRRLEQLVEDAFWRARGNPWVFEPRAMTAAMVVPVISVYLDHAATLDGDTRASLGRLLGWIRDPRIEPAVKKALESFAARPHVNEADAVDLPWAVRAAGELELTGVREPMLRAFFRYSAGVGAPRWYPWDFTGAMIVLADPSWAPTLLALLDAPMPRALPDDKGAQRARDEQAFRQDTAAEVWGALREPAATKPLIRMLLDPERSAMRETVQLALVKIGEPAGALARELLSAGDTHELVLYSRRLDAGQGIYRSPDYHRVAAAGVLGAIGRRDALVPMLEAIKKATGVTRVMLALELTRLPATPESKRAFRAAYEATRREAAPDVVAALRMLGDAAVRFADSETTDWLVARARDPRVARDALLQSAMKLALPEQMAAVERAANGYDVLDSEHRTAAKRELELCGRQIACHLYVLSMWYRSELQHFAPKAAYVLAVLGDARTRDEIIARLEGITDSSVISAAALAIDHLSPDGSVDAAQKIDAIVRRYRFDQNRSQQIPVLDLLASRLRARAR